eukprot:sb/3464768/
MLDRSHLYIVAMQSRVSELHEPTDTSKQPIRTRYKGHVTGCQPIRGQYFLVRTPHILMLRLANSVSSAMGPAVTVGVPSLDMATVTGVNGRYAAFVWRAGKGGVTSLPISKSRREAAEERKRQEPTDTSKQPIRKFKSRELSSANQGPVFPDIREKLTANGDGTVLPLVVHGGVGETPGCPRSTGISAVAYILVTESDVVMATTTTEPTSVEEHSTLTAVGARAPTVPHNAPSTYTLAPSIKALLAAVEVILTSPTLTFRSRSIFIHSVAAFFAASVPTHVDALASVSFHTLSKPHNARVWVTMAAHYQLISYYQVGNDHTYLYLCTVLIFRNSPGRRGKMSNIVFGDGGTRICSCRTQQEGDIRLVNSVHYALGCVIGPVDHFPSPNEPTETSKQPIRTRYLGHVTVYQAILDQYFLFRSVPGNYTFHQLFAVVQSVWL